MWQLSMWRRPFALFVAVIAGAVASAPAGASATAVPTTPIVTACPAGFERLAVLSLEAQGPYILPRLVDTAGNDNGFVCALALPDAVRDAVCRTFGGPACALQQLGLPVYNFKDDDNPALA